MCIVHIEESFDTIFNMGYGVHPWVIGRENCPWAKGLTKVPNPPVYEQQVSVAPTPCGDQRESRESKATSGQPPEPGPSTEQR